jgi:hypothetical protein
METSLMRIGFSPVATFAGARAHRMHLDSPSSPARSHRAALQPTASDRAKAVPVAINAVAHGASPPRVKQRFS